MGRAANYCPVSLLVKLSRCKMKKLTMLAMNGIELEYTQRELYETILKVDASESTFEELLDWVLDHEKR